MLNISKVRNMKLLTHPPTGGQRNWIQVLSNGGFATFLSALFVWLNGVDGDINFNRNYLIAFIQTAILAYESLLVEYYIYIYIVTILVLMVTLGLLK
jgi:general stress protein CsbA